ncbi:MAG: DUF1460 domain-containing protein, partial [Cyanobacteria bacterium REEB65]|nr:DUF1460 domain-containing protein [Cyanobacteria bacterium REEB65]
MQLWRSVMVGALSLAGMMLAMAPQLPGGAASDSRLLGTRFPAADRRRLKQIVSSLAKSHSEAIAKLTAAAGLALVGTPYVAGTLEDRGPEQLVCLLRQLDCMTFVEVSLAIARIVRRQEPPAQLASAFERELAALRYRTDVPEGYASRLHYFSDWVRHNEAAGKVCEWTEAIGGIPDHRPIHFMTAHAARYPKLADRQTFMTISQIEHALTATPR